MAGTEVASLFASLGLNVNAAQWKKADSFIRGIADALQHRLEPGLKRVQGGFDGMAGGLKRIGLMIGTYFGGRAAKGALIDFNATVENTRLNIAGMMALATKTDLQDNFAQADKTLESLRQRAAKLPGTTAEYAKMLGMITQPVLDAKLGMQDLEDITVGAVVAAKALGVEGEVAARDIDQAIRGQFHAVDQLTGKLLGSLGYKGEEGRKRFNAMSAGRRAQVLKQALTQKQITQLAAAQGQSFSGVLSTLQDSLQQFFARVGLPLFRAVTEQVKTWVKWFEDNKEKVEAFAQAVGGVLSTSFGILQTVVGTVVELVALLMSNSELARAVIIALGLTLAAFAVKVAAAWIAGFAPLLGIIAIVTAVVLVVQDLVRAIVDGKGVTAAALRWIADRFKAVGSSIMGAFRAIGNFFTSIARAIKSAFVAVIDWITDKIDWAWSQIKKIGHFIMHPGEALGAAVDFFAGDESSSGPSSAVASTGTASRVVSPQAGGPPTVYLNAPTTVKVTGELPRDAIRVEARTEIKADKERTWRDVSAATGGEDQE